MLHEGPSPQFLHPKLQQFVRVPGGSCCGTDALGLVPGKAFAIPGEGRLFAELLLHKERALPSSGA